MGLVSECSVSQVLGCTRWEVEPRSLLCQKVKVTWHTAKYGDPYSEFVPIQSAHTQRWTHTHTHREHTPGAVGSHFMLRHPGSSWGPVPCSRAPQSWYWRWRECCTFTPPPTYNSCRPYTRTRDLWVTSPTLKPLGHDFPRKALHMELVVWCKHMYLLTNHALCIVFWINNIVLCKKPCKINLINL